LAASPPTDPISYKENVIICHSEQSEESTVFYRTILNLNLKLRNKSTNISISFQNEISFQKETHYYYILT